MPNQSPLEFDLDDHLAAARELAANTSPQALLTAFANLTHRLHASEDDQHSADLRVQRGIVEAELLRRMGAQPQAAPVLPPRRIVDAPQA